MKAQNSHSVLLDLPGFVGEWAFSDQVVVEVLGSVVVDSTAVVAFVPAEAASALIDLAAT